MSSIYHKNGSSSTVLTWPEWKYPKEEKILAGFKRQGEATEYIMGLIKKQAELEMLIIKNEEDLSAFRRALKEEQTDEGS